MTQVQKTTAAFDDMGEWQNAHDNLKATFRYHGATDKEEFMNPQDEKQVRELLASAEARDQWGITTAHRYARVCFIFHMTALIAMVGTAIYYLLAGDSSLNTQRTSGLFIVLALVFAVSVLRIFQLRAEICELPDFKHALARKLTGEDEHDTQAQAELEKSYVWRCKPYQIVARMAGITALVLILINTNQLQVLDSMRTIVFDFCILTFLAGASWNNFAFKEMLLTAELEERARASARWRREHPQELLANEPEAEETEE